MGLSLGIDTSNYKTSIALVDKDDVIFYDDRRFLSVEEGKRGLRQQEAFFQHVNRLPRMIKPMFNLLREMEETIDVIAVSDRPRNVDDSYMPTFMAGKAFADTLASSLNVPVKYYSHQEGHIAAGKRFTAIKDRNEFIAFHFSGGTTEALKYKVKSGERPEIEIVGGTKDISFGQLIDRIGVKMGYPFPAGEEMDNGAIRAGSGNEIFDSVSGYSFNDAPAKSEDDLYIDFTRNISSIAVNSPYINLSGIETSLLRYLDSKMDDNIRDSLSLFLFSEIAQAIIKMMGKIEKETGLRDFLFVGGVSSSSYIRSYIESESVKIGYNSSFASPDLASDNAVGIAFLGGDSIWR